MVCTERKRLVANHLRAIAEWKEAAHADFNAGERPATMGAWNAALEAEQAIHDHREEHGCDEVPEGRAARM